MSRHPPLSALLIFLVVVVILPRISFVVEVLWSFEFFLSVKLEVWAQSITIEKKATRITNWRYAARGAFEVKGDVVVGWG